jgi:hypothetical protein
VAWKVRSPLLGGCLLQLAGTCHGWEEEGGVLMLSHALLKAGRFLFVACHFSNSNACCNR